MRKKIALIFLMIIILTLPFFPTIKRKVEWKMTAQAVGGYPYQLGLSGVIVIPCITTGLPPVCQGGTLCYLKDVATCVNYSDVAGVPAGGSGNNALFLNVALGQAGVNPGGQLIAGGMSPVLMDSGVLGGPAGCYGCMAAMENENFFAKAKDIVMAVLK